MKDSGVKAFFDELEQLRKYRLIGTLEECKSAREKQMPKKPDMEGDGYDDNGELIFDTWICPSCGRRYFEERLEEYIKEDLSRSDG